MYQMHNTLENKAITSSDRKEQECEHLKELLTQVADNQDKSAFAQLFKWFSPKIHAFGLRQFKNEASAMDLVQETMTLVWRKAHLYHPDKGKATTWVFTVMRNHSFDMLRKKQSAKEDNLSDDLWPMIEANQCSEEEPQDHLLTGKLMQHIDLLPEKQKQVVEAIYLKEMTHQQLADHLGIPVGTVKSRLRLAMEKLKQELERHYD